MSVWSRVFALEIAMTAMTVSSQDSLVHLWCSNPSPSEALRLCVWKCLERLKDFKSKRWHPSKVQKHLGSILYHMIYIYTVQYY